ncbi:hypothetical protein [Shewanella dokdonensis]|uniref:Uncharacterized protein n=1 Tax=Shewanella dokdonensis TaxID=712036 RepID=A0ABX8DBH8_9GAMM|nr:hypothetical protein [Shewanella dokdonensis]MCL1075416.1 hypothetical protein [Shewanella dokdonensis]QVK22106.1 hypothetical protein KHX94_11635 [Shewanella dokdonensis]
MEIRKGSSSDLRWIVKLLKEGARDGHFLPTMQMQAEGYLNSVIEHGGVQMIKLRNSIQAPVFVPMELSVAEIDGSPSSFLVCCKENNEVEVHLAGTKTPFKQKGCFTYLVQDTISKNQNSKIYARCYRKSSIAIDALKKLNFEIAAGGDPIELVHTKIKPNKQINGTRKTWLSSLWSSIVAKFS